MNSKFDNVIIMVPRVKLISVYVYDSDSFNSFYILRLI